MNHVGNEPNVGAAQVERSASSLLKHPLKGGHRDNGSSSKAFLHGLRPAHAQLEHRFAVVVRDSLLAALLSGVRRHSRRDQFESSVDRAVWAPSCPRECGRHCSLCSPIHYRDHPGRLKRAGRKGARELVSPGAVHQGRRQTMEGSNSATDVTPMSCIVVLISFCRISRTRTTPSYPPAMSP
jgi:hypothetical protein